MYFQSIHVILINGKDVHTVSPTLQFSISTQKVSNCRLNGISIDLGLSRWTVFVVILAELLREHRFWSSNSFDIFLLNDSN